MKKTISVLVFAALAFIAVALPSHEAIAAGKCARAGAPSASCPRR